jgi:hypothetical protein
MRERLQAQLSRGQVYTIHADTRLSYMIRNSEFNRAGEAERGKLVSSVEKQALAFLDKYRNYEYIRIYFLGEGTAGINSPYLCRRSDNACRITEKREAS